MKQFNKIFTIMVIITLLTMLIPTTVQASLTKHVIPISINLNKKNSFGYLDNDTYPDVVIGAGNTGYLTQYLNNATTWNPYHINFTDKYIHNPNDGLAENYIFDINGDSHNDILVRGVSPNIRYYLNNGSDSNPGFGTGTIIDSGRYTNWLEPIDFDQDGDMDFVTSYWRDAGFVLWGNVSVYLNNGSATNPGFSLLGVFNRTWSHFPSYAGDVGDLDGDGDNDIIVGRTQNKYFFEYGIYLEQYNSVVANSTTALYLNFNNDSRYNENYSNPTDVDMVYNYGISGNGTTNGGIEYIKTHDIRNGYFNFSSSNEYILIPSNNSLRVNATTGTSWEAWVKMPSGMTTQSDIFCRELGTQYAFSIQGGGTAYGAIWLTTSYEDVSGTTDLRDDKWHHVAMTYNGTDLKMYVDGELEGTDNTNKQFDPNVGTAQPLYIGSRSGGGVNNFEGMMDDPAMWNRCLSAEEIKGRYDVWTTNITINATYYASEIEIIDYNNDGLNDIVACSTYTDDIYVFRNNGTTPYIPELIGNLINPFDLECVDFDKDGDIDVVISGTSYIGWYEYEEISDTWVQHIVAYAVPMTAGGINLIDMDNDGDYDIGSGDNSYAAFFINNIRPRINYTTLYPANNSIMNNHNPGGIDFEPRCSVNVTDWDNSTMDIYFASNVSGSWVTYQVNRTVGNGTYMWDFTQADDSGKYWWRVNCDDGINNQSILYNFRLTTNFTYVYRNGTFHDIYSYHDDPSSGNLVYNWANSYAELLGNGAEYISPTIHFSDLPWNASWENITYITNVSRNLPSNRENDTSSLYQVDMTNCVGLYHMDDNISNNITIYDTSGLSNHGTADSSIDTDIGIVDFAKDFTVAGDSIEIVNTPSLQTMNTLTDDGFTISMWINPTELPSSHQVLASKRPGWQFYLTTEGSPPAGEAKLRIYSASSGIATSTGSFNPVNGWHHVAVTIDGSGNGVFYHNGTSIGSFGPWQSAATTNNIVISKHQTIPNTHNFKGLIDEMAFFNKSIKPSQISAMYNRTNQTLYNIDFSVRTGSTEAGLLASPWTDVPDYSPIIDIPASIRDGKFFQYKVNLTRADTAIIPFITNISIYASTPETTPPSIIIDYPIDEQIYNKTVGGISFNITDVTNISHYWLSDDKGVTYTSPVAVNAKTFTTNYTGFTPVTGWNTWTVYANDTWGNNMSLGVPVTFYIPPMFEFWYQNTTLFNSYRSSFGTLTNLEVNTETDTLALSVGQTSGSYLSQIYDAALISTWRNITVNANISDLEINKYSNLSILLHLNGTSGDTIDSSGNGNDGDVYGCTRNSSGVFSTGFDFDGNADYITIPSGTTNSIAGDDTHTIAFWFKPQTFGGNPMLVDACPGLPNGMFIEMNGINGMYWRYGSDYRRYTLSINMVPDEWYHLACVKTGPGDSGNMYLNGVLQSSWTGAFGGNMPSGAYNMQIGRYSNVATFDYHGSIDEFAVWNKTLSQGNVTDLYQRGIMRLNLSVRSCDDALGVGDPWTDLGNIINTTQPINISAIQTFNDENRWFQYKIDYYSPNISFSPEVFNVSIQYITPEQTSPNITIIYPIWNQTYNKIPSGLQFNITDGSNVDWYWLSDDNGTSFINLTHVNVSYLDANYTGTLNVNDGWNYWRVYANDTYNNSDFAVVRFYVTPMFEFWNQNGTLFNQYRCGNGILENLLWNITNNGLKLTSKYANFTSQVYNTGLISTFDNISWNWNVNQLSNPIVDTSDAVLIMEFNNDSNYGETRTHFYDYSGNNNNGTLSTSGGAYLSYDQKYNGTSSLYCDGTATHKLIIPDDPTLRLTNMSLEAWVYPTANQFGWIMDRWQTASNQRSWGLSFDGATSISLSLSDNGASWDFDVHKPAPGSVPLNTWTHVVAIYNSTNRNVKVYINGVEQYNGTSTVWTVHPGTSNLEIGAQSEPGATSRPFAGYIDSVAIYPRVLTAGEIENRSNRNQNTITMYARGDLDNTLAGDPWIEVTDGNLHLLGESQYFQYRAQMVGDNTTYNSFLQNITIDYTTPEETPPNITIIYPIEEQIYNKVPPGLQFNITDPSNVKYYWLSDNNGTTTFNLTHINNSYLDVNYTGLLNTQIGWNYWTVYANDTYGNTGNATIKFYITPYIEYWYSNGAFHSSYRTPTGTSTNLNWNPDNNGYNITTGNTYGNYTSQIYDATNVSTWVDIMCRLNTTTNTSLNLSVRACNDALGAGGDDPWVNIGNITDGTVYSLSLTDTQWFQYKIIYDTANASYTPYLFNVTINYDIPITLNITNEYPYNNSIGNITDRYREPINHSATIIGATNASIWFYNMTPVVNTWTLLYNITPPTDPYRFNFTDYTTFGRGTEFIWGNTSYTWSINITDGSVWLNQSYIYTTNQTNGGQNMRYDVTNDNAVGFADVSSTWAASVLIFDGLYDVSGDNAVGFADVSEIWANA